MIDINRDLQDQLNNFENFDTKIQKEETKTGVAVHKRRSFSIQLKLQVIQEAKHTNYSKAAQLYKIDRQTVT